MIKSYVPKKQKKEPPMASITQKSLFCWEDVTVLGDLERLSLVIKHLPDEKLIQVLEDERNRGRNDYPVRAMFNSLLAAVVFEHGSIESLRRELLRNGQLRDICGFDLWRGANAVPSSSAYSRFLKNLMKHQQEFCEVFEMMVGLLGELLPDFGKDLAIDGKAIASHARGKKKDEQQQPPDGRRDIDANWASHGYGGKDKKTGKKKAAFSWFGYKLHLVIDSNYELPVAYRVEKASHGEVPQAYKLLDHLEAQHKELLDRCSYFSADRGYDAGGLITRLYDEYEIAPVIDIRNSWRDGEDTKQVEGKENVVYTYEGEVFCVCPCTGVHRQMPYGGYEKDRRTQKYRCPVRQYGLSSGCTGEQFCPVRQSTNTDTRGPEGFYTRSKKQLYVEEIVC
jgi:hypothetical protein